MSPAPSAGRVRGSQTEIMAERDTPAPEAVDPTRDIEEGYRRFQRFDYIGSGGIGFVRSCVDPNLGRTVALKMLHPYLQNDVGQRVRFVREARVVAQLEHPNIVPVHELGVRADGSIYFTMKHVRGATLLEVLDRLKSRDEEFQERYPRSVLLDIFLRVCQAAAFAHSHGVIHRDLKPENVKIGDFGEVQVMDWGLVKVLGLADEESEHLDADDSAGRGENGSALNVADLTRTLEGQISGTPLYMSPEQAAGRVSELDERSDLYSLGALLYELLTLQQCVAGESVEATLRRVIHFVPRSPRRRAPHLRIPPELDAICMKCLAKRKEERYANVPELIQDLERFRSGRPVSACPEMQLTKAWKWCRRHPVISTSATAVIVALLMVASTALMARSVRCYMLTREADKYREEGDSIFEEKVRRFRELDALRAANILKEKSTRELELERLVSELHLQSENKYQTAVMLYIKAGGAGSRTRRAYADVFSRQIGYAVLSRDYTEFKRIVNFISNWLGDGFEAAVPAGRQWLLDMADRLKGGGSLRISTRPPGASVKYWQLKPDPEGILSTSTIPLHLGVSPTERIALGKGSYLLGLSLADRPDVLCPVNIDDGEREEIDVFIPSQVPPGTIYVPAGRCYIGGPQARFYRLHERDVAGFFIKTHEVTFVEYLEYWRDTRSSGRSDDDMSRVRLRRDELRFYDAWDEDGRMLPPLQPGWPVVGLTHAAAVRYCQWLGERLGRECRLPTAEEWEKAARGVDGREYVWGNRYDAGFAFTAGNREAHSRFGLFAPPGSVPTDRSVYGVMDMAGNVREWTLSRFSEGSLFFQIKGASAATSRYFLSCAYASDTPVVPTDVGFRYVVPVDEQIEEL